MALRVLNQISSIKVPKTGSIRSFSADRSPRLQNTPTLFRRETNEVVNTPKLQIFSCRKRSVSLPIKCNFCNYTRYQEPPKDCEIEEDDKSLDEFRSKLQKTLPINYEQFSPRKSDEIEDVSRWAEECYKKYKTRTNKAAYCLKDSTRRTRLSEEDDLAFKKKHMHNDYATANHLQPRNLIPFDQSITIDPEQCDCTPIGYYYTKPNKSKLLEKPKNITQERSYSSSSTNAGENEIKLKDFSKKKLIFMKSYSDHVKEANSSQTVMNSVANNQKRTFSMDSNRVKPAEKQVSTKHLSSVVSKVHIMKDPAKPRRFEPSMTQRVYLSRIAQGENVDREFLDTFTCQTTNENASRLFNTFSPPPNNEQANKLINTCSPQTNNGKANQLTTTFPSQANNVETNQVVNTFSRQTNNEETNKLSNTFSRLPHNEEAPPLLYTFPRQSTNEEANNPNGENVRFAVPNVYTKLAEVADLNKALPFSSPAPIPFEPVSTKTVASKLAKSVTTTASSQTRNTRNSATYTFMNKMLFGNPYAQLSTCCKTTQTLCAEEEKRGNNFRNSFTLQRHYATTTANICDDQNSKKRPDFPKSKIPKAVLDQNKLDLFDGVCDDSKKKYQPTRPCDCIEPHLPTKLPKMKRLRKRYPTDVDEKKTPQPECEPFKCPPRADDKLKEKKKTLPSLPSGGCPCVEPPPLDPCNPLPRLSKRLVMMDKYESCAEEKCPPRADAKLVSPKKCLKKLSREPLDCKCLEPHLPTKLPKMPRLPKKLNLAEIPIPKHCEFSKCPPRADDGVNLYHQKVLPKIDSSQCPCVEPSRLDECSALPRLKKRAVYQDPEVCTKEPCPLKADDVCGYETTKKKLKPLLPCSKTTGLYKNHYSTMTRSFITIPLAGVRKHEIAEKSHQSSSNCEEEPKKVCKEEPKKVCKVPPPLCKVPPPLCPPPKKEKSYFEKLLHDVINYFKARPDCPPPDAWKKKFLREKAEKAAKAAGMELCEPKCNPVPKDPCAGSGSIRNYSSSSWSNDSRLCFTNDSKLANEVELKRLIYRILKLMRVDDQENTSETCDQLLKEFMELSDEEFEYIKLVIGDAHDSLLYGNTVKSSPLKRSDLELEHKMIETLDLFCKKASYLRNITYLEYEELEKMKTRNMQKRLDEMMKKYKIDDED